MPENDKVSLRWIGLSDEEEDAGDLLALYFQTVANGPMIDYRHIYQRGSKQGQSLYAHVLEGVGILHELRSSGIVEIDDLEERLLLSAFTIHDINKIELYNPRDSKAKYADVATIENIRAELRRLRMDEFFAEWEDYLEEIKLLAHSHQHDAKPLADLNLRSHRFKLGHSRLVRLGELMHGVDNLSLSHTLEESAHKQEFLGRVETVSARSLRWVTHRLGENRGLLTNVVHNVVVAYLRQRHALGNAVLAPMLYYAEGVAYLAAGRQPFDWSDTDVQAVAGLVAREVDRKKLSGLPKFIKGGPSGIKVNKAAIEGGASFGKIMDVIHYKLARKNFSAEWHAGYNRKLRPDIEDVATAGEPYSARAQALLEGGDTIVPLEQDRLRQGDLISAYRNLLEEYFKDDLKKRLGRTSWTHIYALLGSSPEDQALYTQVDPFRRGHFIARDSRQSFEALFDALNADLAVLAGEERQAGSEGADMDDWITYLRNNLEVSARGARPDFKANLRQYTAGNHKQCGTCSSPRPTGEWMAANAPGSLAVQFFSNRLAGGSSREPKRNICAICRAQFILEKLAWLGHTDKHGGEYTTFYLHLYPYTFFTAPYLRAMRRVFTMIRFESREAPADAADAVEPGEFHSLLLDTAAWNRRYEASLRGDLARRARELLASPKKINGIGLSAFGESLGNTPTLPLTAPGDNYGKQFIFALNHALAVADFFGTRLVLSRTPTPLFSGEYLDAHKLAFFVDGTPRALRWLVPGDGYRRLESYRGRDSLSEYNRRRENWSNERPDPDGYFAVDNLARRMAVADRLSRQLSTANSKGIENNDDLFVELITAAGDDPFAVYHVADRAIEERIRAPAPGTRDRGKAAGKASPEVEAIHLRKQVAGLLAELAREHH